MNCRKPNMTIVSCSLFINVSECTNAKVSSNYQMYKRTSGENSYQVLQFWTQTACQQLTEDVVPSWRDRSSWATAHSLIYRQTTHLFIVQLTMTCVLSAVLQVNFMHMTNDRWKLADIIGWYDSVRWEKSFVCHITIGKFFSAKKSWPTKNIFKHVWRQDDISAEITCCDWSVSSVWNIQAAERRCDDQSHGSISS